jgi:hypothetical protein
MTGPINADKTVKSQKPQFFVIPDNRSAIRNPAFPLLFRR